MNTYEDTMSQLSEMNSRFQSGFSFSDRQLLDKLHRQLFGKEITNTGCSDCYRDAYVIILSHLKQNKTMPKTPNYILKAGALIHPVGTSKFYTNPLPSDDIAEEHLSQFPDAINLFAHFPEDWEDRVNAYKERKESEREARQAEEKSDVAAQVQAQADTEAIEALQSDLSKSEEARATLEKECAEAKEKVKSLEIDNFNLQQQIDGLTAELENRESAVADTEDAGEESEELAQLRMELETVKAELESANDEISTLKTDNRALKAANTRLKNNSAKEAE